MAQTGSITVSDRVKLQKLYNESGPAAFGSINNLTKASGISREKVTEFLQSKDSYTKYKGIRRKFPRLNAHARYIDEIWCLDLAQMDKLSQWNRVINFLLVTVDVFSRYLRVEPLRRKGAEAVKAAFIKMCSKKSELKFPKKLWLDQRKEFFGDMVNFCEDVGVKYYHTYSETKVTFGERAIRTLKNLIYRYLEENDTLTYIKELQMFVDVINSRINRNIGLAPKDVVNADFLTVMYKRMKLRKNTKPKFQVGDKVRLALAESKFQKGYKPHYTHEIFLVRKINTLAPFPTYFVVDQKGENIDGIFYEQELSKVA